MASTHAERHFLPAAGRDLFLPLYDPFTKLAGVDGLRRILLEQAALQPSSRVLDVGCGTGALAILIKRLHPTITVVGVDPDPRALARAERKARAAEVSVHFGRGFADMLAYADASFDRVFSSLMFHHLGRNEKERSLREIRRVLRPGGRLEFLDIANARSHSHGLLARLIHSHQQMKDNVDERIVQLMTAAGFAGPQKIREHRLIFGTVAFFQAAAPDSARA
jgi:ubiquinone/menaquinone biosynthesis C-methylase UbiE